MSDLAEWLLARVAEDEQAARAAFAGPWRYNPRKQWRGPIGSAAWLEGEEFVGAGLLDATVCVAATGPADEPQSMADAAHIARHDPTRVLADCQARRQIIELLAKYAASCPEDDWPENGDMWQAPVADRARHLLRLFAQPWRDHPDFDPAWAVDHAPTGS